MIFFDKWPANKVFLRFRFARTKGALTLPVLKTLHFRLISL